MMFMRMQFSSLKFYRKVFMYMYMDLDSVFACSRAENNTRCKRSGGCSNNGCSCEKSEAPVRISDGACQKKKTWGLENYPLASVFAPMQNFDKVLDKDTALSNGTMFEELVLPFMGESVYNGKGGNCRG